MDADYILYDGHIYTMDPGLPQAQAMALGGNRILAVGDNEQILSLKNSNCRAIHLGGRTVLPGFIDCHIHFADWALAQQQVDLTGSTDIQDILRRVQIKVDTRPPGAWILGSGFDPNLLPGGAWPSHFDLDPITPQHPVMLVSKDMHSCWVNSLAMERASINATTSDITGGVIQRHPLTRAPTGILQENALELVQRVIPPLSTEEVAQAIQTATPKALAEGLTGIHEIWDTPTTRNLRAFQHLSREQNLSLRVYHHFPLTQLQNYINAGIETGFGNEWLRLAGVKLFADGALGSRTALLLQPYENNAGNVGVAAMSLEELKHYFYLAHHAGISVSIHAIGDRANREVLDAFTTLGKEETERHRIKKRQLRHRIEHVQLLSPEDLPRLAQLGLIASMQPIHATSDMFMAEQYWGSHRIPLAYAWRDILASGASLCFGSDAPVESFSVIHGINAAVTRCRPNSDPGPEGWMPHQRLTAHQAIHAYTMAAAYASGEENIKGSLSPGKLADAVVLSQDIMTCPPTEILNTQVLATLIDGQFVYGPCF